MTLTSILCYVEVLWRITGEQTKFCTSKWEGWILVYLKKACFNQHNSGQSRKDLYKAKFISSVNQILEKVGSEDLEFYFNGNNNIHY